MNYLFNISTAFVGSLLTTVSVFNKEPCNQPSYHDTNKKNSNQHRRFSHGLVKGIIKKLVRPDSNRHAPNYEFDCRITRIPQEHSIAIILPIKSLTSFCAS